MVDEPETDGLYIGLMSGTSLDGIDVALCRIDNNKATLVNSLLYPWPAKTLKQIQQLINSEPSLEQLLTTDQLCAREYANASLACLKQAGLNATDIIAIGSHGQTIRHAPESDPAYTLQIGNPATISELTNITTVADFRSRDIAAGGQGAPLAPAFHLAMLGDRQKRVVLNIGGIANITILGQNEVTGFDTGPGNRLLNDWCQSQHQQPFDKDGQFAASGQVNQVLLEQLLADDYFSRTYPKSTGSDYFNLYWLEKHLPDFGSLPAADIQATLAELSAASITEQIKLNAPDTTEVLVCGGGWHNLDLIKRLQQHLGNISVYSTEKYGISPDWMEAMAFAWLAYRTMNGQAGNLPEVTGANGYRICGGIYPA